MRKLCRSSVDESIPMSKKKLLLALLISILNCVVIRVSAFEELGEVTLQPMEKPLPLPMVAGTEQHWLKSFFFKNKKKEHIIYYKTVNTKTYSVRDSDGCSWTRMTNMFAPTLQWYDCYQERTGIQEIVNSMGTPWPLSEITEFEYEFTGRWDDGFGAQWHETRKCKVDSQVRVRVPAGEFNTYKLICEDPSLKWTYWISPKLGHRVAYELVNKTFISRSYMLELVKVVKP